MILESGRLEQNYMHARNKFAEMGIDTDAAIRMLKSIPVSIPCWQGDDVKGFEDPGRMLAGGIQATGRYPGAARNAAELRQDLEKAFALIPGKKRANLHAIYLEANGVKVDRDEIGPEHFENWVKWAEENGVGLDFNPTLFSHPMSDDGLTLSHPDKRVRDFWIEHVRRCRKIGEYFGIRLGTPSIVNIWIPDGCKDIPADRLGPRLRLKDSLDRILEDKIDKRFSLTAIEGKVFGIGSESYVVGSHEFYLGYAVRNNLVPCLDTGHYHPTELVSDKISALSLFVDQILLHVSRPVRWDSDHVVILDGELMSIAREIVGNKLTERVHVGLDFFDASINRIAAWTIGARNMQKALLIALLEPSEKLKDAENAFDFTTRLALMEEMKSYPWNAVWDYYCAIEGVPAGIGWLEQVREYESEVLAHRHK